MIRCGSSTWRSGTSPRPQATSWPRPSSPFPAGTVQHCGSSTWRSGTSPRPQATSWPRPSSPFPAGTALRQLYLAVRNFTTPTGNELAEAFLSLPSRYSTALSSSTWRSGTSPRPQAPSWPRPSSPFLAGTQTALYPTRPTTGTRYRTRYITVSDPPYNSPFVAGTAQCLTRRSQFYHPHLEATSWAAAGGAAIKYRYGNYLLHVMRTYTYSPKVMRTGNMLSL
jgi:hypothetical protein